MQTNISMKADRWWTFF